MADIESGYLGAVAHAVLTAIAVAEGIGLKSRVGKLAAGCCAGWHAYATFYHLTHPREVDTMSMSSKKESR